MKFNNSMKIAIANFSLFWKILLYKLIAGALSVLFVLPIFSTLRSVFSASGFFTQIKNMFTTNIFKSFLSLLGQIYNLFETFFDGILTLAKNNVFVFVYFLIVLLIVIPFLLKLSDVPASESVYSYMSSLNKNSFTINFVSMLDKSLGYSILRTLMEIPFWIILIFGCYKIAGLGFYSEALVYLSPLLMFVFIVLMFDFNITIFNGFAPSIVVFNKCAGKSLKKGIKSVSRNFSSTFSSFAVTMTVMLAICYLFGIYALIAIVPLMALINAVFGQVLFFESQGMDYYISLENIITPRKLETADKIKKVKNII